VDFVLVPAGIVHFGGVLRDALGSPVAGYVSLYNQDDPSQSQENQATSEGAFSFAVAPGEYRIYLQSGGNANAGLPLHWGMMTQPFDLSEDRTQDLTLPETVDLTVQVSDPSGEGRPAMVKTGSVPMSDVDLGGGIHLSSNAHSGDAFEHPTDPQGRLILPFFPSDHALPGQGLATALEGSYAPTHFDIPALGGPTVIHISLQSTVADDAPPQLVSCDEPDGLWHPSNLTLLCYYEDAVSGELLVSLHTDVKDGEETANAVALANGAQACDASGNCAEPPTGIAGNKIDRKSPTISVSSPLANASYVLGEEIPAEYECTDLGSGVEECEGAVADGMVIDGEIGDHTFTVTSKDQVRNSTSTSLTYTVIYSTARCHGSLGHTVLPPVRADGSSVFPRGVSVPIDFRVCDANGVSVGSQDVLVGSMRPVLVSKTNGDGGEDAAVISATSQDIVEWNSHIQAWEFEQSTVNLVPGVTYTYRIDLADGSSIEYAFAIRRGRPNR